MIEYFVAQKWIKLYVIFDVYDIIYNTNQGFLLYCQDRGVGLQVHAVAFPNNFEPFDSYIFRIA